MMYSIIRKIIRTIILVVWVPIMTILFPVYFVISLALEESFDECWRLAVGAWSSIAFLRL